MTRRLSPRDVTYSAVFAALIAICAWFSFPAAIPFTLQTFGVFLSVFLLGGRRGSLCITVYLLLGAVGLPVFSLFRGGPGILFGAGGGFLLGFLPTVLFLRYTESRWVGRPRNQLLFSLPALFILYTFGALWYLPFCQSAEAAPLAAIVSTCILPFILPDLLKISLAVFLSHRIKKALKTHFPYRQL